MNDCGLNNKIDNSFIPALIECERFVNFIDIRFNLGLKNNFVITINKAGKNTLGFFMCKESKEHFTNTTQDLNNINLNTFYLKNHNVYEILTHETTHFKNYIDGIKDGNYKSGYHNKHFKNLAEKLLLKVDRTEKGFNMTGETEDFNKMLVDFKPNKDAFNIFQNIKESDKQTTRNKLYMCSCGVKVRCAIELNATCNNCNSKFIKE
jgi:hypothetical protein